jgi:glycosyltransferase involved in cell wall biosynthesis
MPLTPRLREVMRTAAWRKRIRPAAAAVKRAVSALGVDASPGSLLLVTGGGDWAVRQIALALQPHLADGYREVNVLDHLWQRPYVARANIHCLCRPAFFGSDDVADVHRSNRVVVSWLHGGKHSDEPQLVAAARQLERHWRRVNHFVVPNQDARTAVLECGVDPAIVHMIPNGVDTTMFTPPPDATARQRIRAELDIPADAFVVGSFQRDGDDDGRPKLVKGPDILVSVLAAVNKQRPVVALLTGSGRTYVRRGLEQASVPYVHKWLDSPSQLPSMYHAIDAYLITAREEGGPASLRESMASGVPVVSTRMGLAADLIEHRVNGLVSDVGDVEGLSRSVCALFDEPGLGRELAEHAFGVARQLDYGVIASRLQREVYAAAFQ